MVRGVGTRFKYRRDTECWQQAVNGEEDLRLGAQCHYKMDVYRQQTVHPLAKSKWWLKKKVSQSSYTANTTTSQSCHTSRSSAVNLCLCWSSLDGAQVSQLLCHGLRCSSVVPVPAWTYYNYYNSGDGSKKRGIPEKHNMQGLLDPLRQRGHVAGQRALAAVHWQCFIFCGSCQLLLPSTNQCPIILYKLQFDNDVTDYVASG